MNTISTWSGRLTPRRVATFAVALVAVVAAVVSYAHMQQLASTAGEGWRAHLLPLSVDGLLIAAAMSMVVSRLHGRRPSALAWIALTLGIVASLAANVAAAQPSTVGRLVAAWSPLALAVSFELLMQQIRRTRPEARTVPAAPSIHKPEAAPAPTRTTHSAPGTDSKTAPKPPAKRATRTTAGRAQGAQARARAVYERAVAEGRADDLTGAVLAREVGASPGAARKWLAAFRAEQQHPTTPTAPSAVGDDYDSGTEMPRLAVVGESYPGGDGR